MGCFGGSLPGSGQQSQGSQNIVPGAVAAKRLDVLVAHDGEGTQNVGRIVSVQAIEPEKQRIQRSQAGAALFIIPGQRRQHLVRRIHIAQITRKRRHVVRGVGQRQPWRKKITSLNAFLTISVVLLRLA